MKKSIETYIVDSFTNEPFKGNPAGVCILTELISEDQMLSIAKELGLSETAFVFKLNEPNKYSIRYFSPKREIPLCGHATLAASKILFSKIIDLNNLTFVNIQDLNLIIERAGEQIKMEFPLYNTEPKEVPQEMLKALGLEEIVNSVYNEETNIILLEIKSSKTLSQLKPDFNALLKTYNSIDGVLVTAPSSKSDFDFESRYFWPWAGTNEDPVTGATHTFLTKYWSKRLGKTKMNAFQCSERTGFMEVEIINEKSLVIKSTAQIVFEGKLFL